MHNVGAKVENPEASLNTFSILLRMETVYALCLKTVMDIPYFYFGIPACKRRVCDLCIEVFRI